MNLYNISDKIVFKILQDINNGYLEIEKLDGELIRFGNPKHSLKAYIRIKKPNFTFNLIKGGSIGFAESYMRDEFETNNLSNLIEITARNIKIIYKFSGLLDLPIINFFKNTLIKNTKRRSKENIAKHYDLGNEFFSLWLDKTLTYSSAIFEEKSQNLSDAQNNKYQKLINLIKPKNGDKVLEIGCGWGGFAEYLGKKYDVKLDCITISKKQYEYAKERIHKCGLNEKVNIQIKDYRDLKDKYNSIASIEMIEAVGKNYLDSRSANKYSYICFHSRDRAYLQHYNNQKDWSYHDFRDSNIDTYLPAMEHFTKLGYPCFRMGSKVEKKIETNNNNIIDYASSSSQSDFLDVYIASKCFMAVYSESGISVIPEVFDRPIVYVNWPA